MFGTLRAQLIAALAFVILLSLALAGTAAVFLLREYQSQLALNRLAELLLPISFQVNVLERAGADPTEIGRFLDDQAEEMRVRLLLVDGQSRVLTDTKGTLVGQSLPEPPLPPSPLPNSPQTRPRPAPPTRSHVSAPDGQRLYFVGPLRNPARPPNERVPQAPNYAVILAVPEESVAAGWLALAPTLSIAAAISLLVSVGVAIVIARSISGPIAQITQASESMARGDYDQYIDVRRRDEVGKLADSFNTMAREVARTHRTLKDFLINVSHDLRTPLTSIQGFAQAMVDGTIRTPEEYADAAAIIEEEAGRMRRLVGNLLDLSRLESGQIGMQQESIDISALISDVVRRARRLATDNSVEVSLESEPVPELVGDAHWLEEVFVNLLENATKHTPAGGRITVHVDSSPATPRGSALAVVRVHNTGSYIPPDELPRVFERFYQADRSRSGAGSGLGLAIVSEVVQAHGGHVTVTSDPTSGTAFTVSLPLIPTSARASTPA